MHSDAKQPADFNPYAPPTIAESCLAPVQEVVGMWRDGNNLVLHRDFVLPAKCARTLEPADSVYRFQSGFWRMTHIAIPVSRKWTRQRWWRFAAYLCLSVLTPVLCFAVFDAAPTDALKTLLAIGGVCLAALFFLLASDMFSPFTWAGTQGPYVSILGFSRLYLRSLPAWPGLKKIQQPVEL